MRILYKPVKRIFSPPKIETPKAPTVAEDEEAARKATEEAERKSRSALAAQEKGGRPSTLFGAVAATQTGIASRRPTILGL